MAIHTMTTRQKIQRHLQTYDFEKLFVDVLGWDYLQEPPLIISFENHNFSLRPLVEKRGVKVYICNPDSQGNFPADPLLRKIEREVIKHAYEHIIIYMNREKTAQVWQWVKREQGKSSATRLHRYYKGQSGEGLAQRLEALIVAINEEDQLRTLEVMGRVTKAFDVERVTRKFYDRFKLEHTAFLQFITGITAQGDREWYASLMLNRLMFIYFIQRKGFLDTKSPQVLDGDSNYLANRLQSMRQMQQQENQFQTFYRYFLMKLFHDGLSKRENERSPELQQLLGNVPYLNGGLFDVHTLESAYPHIDIPDEAFERLFAFFNEFDWHLDNRPLHKDNEINPDVLGYIFEKYINQKQMGAYYTKEDITGYISQNTIISFIFDATEQKDLMAFRPDGSIWSLLREDPDKYIYDAVKKGCNKPLPPEIEAGVQNVAQRGEWNKSAPEEYALPTEIWREAVARRTRYEEVRAKLAAGEVTFINDLITYNLDICKFAVDVITYCEGPNLLNLPRYGLANYIAKTQRGERPTAAEAKQLDNLSHAGKRLMGFCRTNLFKRLESGGPAFIQSIERHILRNYVFLHAIEEGLDLPLGTQDASLLDARANDEDEDALLPETADENEGATSTLDEIRVPLQSEDNFRERAAQVYAQYAGPMRRRFKWLRPSLFNANLKRDLLADARNLLNVLIKCGAWNASKDAKLAALMDLLSRQHANEKVLVFTQFADTVRYLSAQLQARGVQALQGVTGDSADPTELAWRFSPVSNNKRQKIKPEDELRVLVATDVLSEGQNLQDAAIVVNYDLPWAIIRLIQRAGRVDRIGQQSDTIYCYSFLPAEGVERLIRLRERVRQRLQQNAEVVGTDEAFFEDEITEMARVAFEDLYNEKAGVLDGEADSEVDLASQAYQIWKSAIDANPKLRSIIEKLPDVAFSTRAHRGSFATPEGVLLYMRTSEGNDALAWVNRKGENVTQSQLAILRAAACSSDTKAIELPPEQHELVKMGVEHIIEEEKHSIGGQLGASSGARRRTYERLKQFVEKTKHTLLSTPAGLDDAIEEIYKYPLQETARDTLNRQIRSGITDDQLAELVINLRADNRLCQVQEQTEPGEPQIICSLGLFDLAESV